MVFRGDPAQYRLRSYTVGMNKPPTMEAGPGYWVYMKNLDTLAGFSSTPLPEIDFEWS